MKNKKINAVQAWKQMEDLVVPGLRLSVFDRAMYSYLLRHSRLEGKQQLRFSILWLARGACLSTASARKAVRRPCGAACAGRGQWLPHLVSACAECNSLKRERQAEDFIRWLCREGRLSVGELRGRLGALAQLAAGKLRPALPSQRGSASSKISE
jgi:hypothetical protein